MAGYLVPPTKNPGDVLTSALWNSYIRDNLDFGMVRPIADILLGAPAALIDFTSIPATFAHLRVVCSLRGDTAVTGLATNVRFNNDVAANYSSELHTDSINVAAISESLAATSGRLGRCPGSTAPALEFATTIHEIADYRSVAKHKNGVAQTSSRETAASGGMNLEIEAISWFAAVAVINQITIFPSSGNFIAGSRATLYGMGGI